MRVIAGSVRGRRLEEPEGSETRPTTDRVKEGLFNVLQFSLEGRRVLDLFSGTGQLGIEALSRGAAQAVFLDCRRTAVRLIRENLRRTGLEGQARVIQGDAMAWLETQQEPFDIIFLDPPYESGLLELALAGIARRDLLCAGGTVTAEHPADRAAPEPVDPLYTGRSYRYGKIALTLFHRRADGIGREAGRGNGREEEGEKDPSDKNLSEKKLTEKCE